MQRTIQIRRGVPGDEPILRAVRLEAMRDAPAAFGSTYERELGRTLEDWRQWLSSGATFLAIDHDQPCGLVAGARDRTDPTIVQLMAMWVRAAARGSGAADALIAAVVAWGETEGARAVRLYVVKDNARAIRCYARNRFAPNGHELTRERDGAIEIEMVRLIE